MRTRREELEEKRQRKTKIIFSIVMLFILVFSSIAYAVTFFAGSTTTQRYNGYKIHQVVEGNIPVGYVVKLEGVQRQFYTHPQDSASIATPVGFADSLRQAQGIVYLFDPQDNFTPIYDQLRFDFTQNIPKQQGSAVTQNSTLYPFPVITCGESQPGFIVVYLTQGNRSITQEGGCTIVSGSQPTDFALLRDRIIYTYYGVIEN